MGIDSVKCNLKYTVTTVTYFQKMQMQNFSRCFSPIAFVCCWRDFPLVAPDSFIKLFSGLVSISLWSGLS